MLKHFSWMGRLHFGALAVLVSLLLNVHFAAMACADQTMAGAAMIRTDIDSTSETFCKMVGAGGSAFGTNLSGAGRIKTSGSNTTVTSETASSGALAPVAAGDVIMVRTAAPSLGEPFNAGYAAVVISKASDNSITVDPAVDWSAGYQYTFLHLVCGTTIDDGWIDTSNSTRIVITISYLQGDLDNLSWRFWCKQGHEGSVPVIVYPSESDNCGNSGAQASGFCDITTAASTASFAWEDFGPWSSCRIGVKVKTTDSSDAGANLERVTGSVTVTKGGN